MIVEEQNGFVVVSPSTGYKLMKDNVIFEGKVYLGINDKPEYYTEILDEQYIEITNEEEKIESVPMISFDEDGNLVVIKPDGTKVRFKPM